MNKENQNNMAFFDMCNAKDLYKKLKSDYKILNKNHDVYNYMNFIFTARHLENWILNDNNNHAEIKSKCRKILNKNKNQEWSIIITLCNREKHFILKKEYQKYEKQKNKNTGLFDFGNINFSNFSFRTFNYEVQVGNDMKDLDDVCAKIMKDYKLILEE